MPAIADKALSLMSRVNLDSPALSAVKTASRPAEAFVDYLARAPRPRFRFEYERKADMLAFLREHYGAWRHYDTKEADLIAAATPEQAKAMYGTHSHIQPMLTLGKAWWATGSSVYASAFERFFLDTPTGGMFDATDPFVGLMAGLNLDLYFLFLDCAQFTAPGRIAYLDHLGASLDCAWDNHVSRWRQISLGPEGHNWYLNGMHGLPFFGILFPEFKRAEFLARVGMSVVEEIARGHIKADGGLRETNFAYGEGVVLSLWDFYVLAARNGYPLSPGFAEKLLQTTRFFLRLMTPQAASPVFGDGWVGETHLTAMAAIATALTGDGECKWFAEYGRQRRPPPLPETPGQIPECAFWYVGLEGAATYADTRPRRPRLTSVLMGATGYAALRTALAPDARYLAVAAADRGPIVTSHGHNDVFSLEIHAEGIRFIGDLGCAAGYGDSPGRAYDMKTEAHSCLAIVGMEQAILSDEWHWQRSVIPVVRRWISDSTHDFFHGLHEGYYRHPLHQTLHARKIFFVKRKPAYWIILDWLDSDVENDYRAFFHGCAPGQMDGLSVVLGSDSGPRLVIRPPDGDALSVERVTTEERQVYLRGDGGQGRFDPLHYPCFVYAKHAMSDCFVWTVVPLEAGATPPAVTRLPVSVNGIPEDAHGATAVRIAFPRHTDWLCVSHKDFDGDLAFGDHRARGFLAFRRLDAQGKTTLSIAHSMADGICGR